MSYTIILNMYFDQQGEPYLTNVGSILHRSGQDFHFTFNVVNVTCQIS